MSLMRKPFAAVAALVLIAALGACTSDGSSPVGTPPTMEPPTPESTASTAADLTIGFGSLGPARIGMTKQEALATGLFKTGNPAPVDGCPEPPLLWKAAFEGVDVLTDPKGTIVSLGISAKGPATADGIGVGSTLADLKQAYGAQLSGPSDAGYGQSGAYVTKSDQWIGFLFNPVPTQTKDSTPVTFIELTKGKPDLMRDGC